MLTLPNLLTLARLAALPVVICLFRSGHHTQAAAVFVAAMLTDCVDGWLARKLNQRSALGLYLDPVVDKIVVLSLFYELASARLVCTPVPHLLLARELLQNAVRAVAATRGAVVGANWMGKTKAFLQSVVIAWGLLAPAAAAWRGASAATAVRTGLGVAAWAVVALSWAFFAVFVSWNRWCFREAAAEKDPAQG